MADIELVIKIPEGLKNEFESEQWTALSCMEMKEALIHGKPLPKGHGRLKDVDAIVARFKENKKFYVDSYGGFFQFLPMTYKARCDEIDNCVSDVINAQTIIEADTEVDDANSN